DAVDFVVGTEGRIHVEGEYLTAFRQDQGYFAVLGTTALQYSAFDRSDRFPIYHRKDVVIGASEQIGSGHAGARRVDPGVAQIYILRENVHLGAAQRGVEARRDQAQFFGAFRNPMLEFAVRGLE